MLDDYQVHIPVKKLATKQSLYQRFLRYLTSPATDPLEKITDSIKGYSFLKFFPLACGLFIAIVQGFLLH